MKSFIKLPSTDIEFRVAISYFSRVKFIIYDASLPFSAFTTISIVFVPKLKLVFPDISFIVAYGTAGTAFTTTLSISPFTEAEYVLLVEVNAGVSVAPSILKLDK